MGRLPVVHHVVEELVEAGVREIVIISSPTKPALETYVHTVLAPMICAPAGTRIRVIHQGATPGNGGAVLSAVELVGTGRVHVVWADEIFVGPSRTAHLLESGRSTGRPCIALVRVRDVDVAKCGIAITGRQLGADLEVTDLVEKPDPAEIASRWASVGGYVLNDEVVALLHAAAPGPDGEVSLWTALASYAADHELRGCPLGSEWFETGTPGGYARAFAAVAGTTGDLLPHERHRRKDA